MSDAEWRTWDEIEAELIATGRVAEQEIAEEAARLRAQQGPPPTWDEQLDHAIACGWITTSDRQEGMRQLRQIYREHGMNV